MFRTTTQATKGFFNSAFPTSRSVQLGNVEINIPLIKLPDQSGYFCYFKLNDQPDLVEEGARLIAERIQSLGVSNPVFVTSEASTLALAHVLRKQYHINGITFYKTKQLNDIDPISIEYDTVTANKPKELYFDKSKLPLLQDKNIFILDSVCTTGGTVRAMFQLLIKAGISPKNIVEATILFNEGENKKLLDIDANMQLRVHSFSHLPIVPVNNKPPAVLFFTSQPMLKLTVVIASDNPVKIAAVKGAVVDFYQDKNMEFEFKCVKTISSVNEQPIDQEAAIGAANRLVHAEQLVPNADLYVAIENGVYQMDNRYVDKAIIKLKMKDQDEKMFESIPVEFPTQYVEEAKRIGFAKTTVGECMFKAEIVQNAKDPHADLGAKISREVILQSAVLDGLKAMIELGSCIKLD